MGLQRGDPSPRLLGHMFFSWALIGEEDQMGGGTYSTKITASVKVGMSIEVETYGNPLDTENLLCEVPTSVYSKHFKLHILKTGTKPKLNM